MIEQENTPNAVPTPEPSGESYTPRPPRAFKPRGGTDKNAVYKREWYLANRERILAEGHAKNAAKPKKPRSVGFRKRMSSIKRQQWKSIPLSKRSAILAPLAAGRAKQQALFATARSVWAWDCIKDRLDGIGRNALVKKYGSAKQVDYVLRSADIPKSKACKYDRSVPFTRGSGTALQKALGFTKNEFAKRATIRARRVVIWLTKSQNKLDPSEARKCIALRDQIAAKLLSDETVAKLTNLDSYNRAQVLVTIFPRLKAEYQLLLTTIPAVRAYAQANGATQAAEKALGTFVYDEAVNKTRGFGQLLRWLPALSPWMLENWQRFQGNEDARFLAYELIASASSSPWKIVKAALSNRARRLNDRQMRHLLRAHLDATVSQVAKKPERPPRGRGKRTADLIRLYAACRKLDMTVYAMAPILYPISGTRDRKGAEAATRNLSKRNETAIQETSIAIDKVEARNILAQASAGH